jgi:hypothetical protein
MRKSYTVAEGQRFTYPADAMSLSTIMAAGGVSKLSEEAKKRVKMKTVTSGQDCSDMPASSRDIYVQRGWVKEVITHDTPTKVEVSTEASGDEEN